MSQGERRLAAIMFTDVAGYTAMSQRDEASAIQLLEEHRKAIRPLFTRHGGNEVKTMGDAFLVEFPSALEAVRCAFEMQQSLHELNAGRPFDRKMQIRIGVHLGDVVHSQSDVYGDAVNVASRIEPLAEPGGICVTSQVYEQIRNKFEFPMSTMGRRQLKNVGEPTEVYRIQLPWAQEESPGPSGVGNRVAVLPFANMSPDPNDEYFADGMTEEVISSMSKIEGIEVISRTSVMQYKKSPKPVKEVSKELEAGTILEGSIRKAGNRLRVTVQMIDAGKDRHVWAENYDRDLTDVFTIQSDIAKRVADALETRIPREAARTTERKGDVEAYTTYLRAMQSYHGGTGQDLRDAVSLFRLAISRDPGFSRAYAGLAHAMCHLAAAGHEDFNIVYKAEEAAKKALELAPGEPEAHAAMADVHGFLDRFDQSVAEAKRAIELNPNMAEAYAELSVDYSSMAQMERAWEAARKSYELDPLSVRPMSMLGWISLMSGRNDEALRMLNRLRELNPRYPRAYSSLCECYMVLGDFAKAEEFLIEGEKIDAADPSIRLDRGLFNAFTGKTKEAQSVLAVIMKDDKESVRLYGQLFINCALGNMDEAMAAVMRMAETHSWPFLINVSPLFRELRADPRYSEFLRKLGFPPDVGRTVAG